MQRPRPRTLGLVASAVWVLLAPGAEATTLDTEGKGPVIPCPQVRVTTAMKNSGGDRSYVFEGPCYLFPGGPVANVRIKAEFRWLGQSGNAFESAEVTGYTTGTVTASAKGCPSDPFVAGSDTCKGDKSFTQRLSIPLGFKFAPMMSSRVPKSQAYATAPTPPPTPIPPGSYQVRIATPTENQKFGLDTLAIEVRFVPIVPSHPPTGGVRLEWGREANGQCTFDMGSNVLGHHTMAQMLGKNTFSQPGRYCLRATAKAGTWTPPRRIFIFGKGLQQGGGSTPPIGSTSEGQKTLGGSTGREKTGPKVNLTPKPKLGSP